MSIYPPGYYVYAYIRLNDSNTANAGTPYYIGKGKGNRITRPHGCGVPYELWRRVIISYDLTNFGACLLERRLIRWYGRKDLGTGILNNHTNGGEGSENPNQTTRAALALAASRIHKGKKRSSESRIKMSLAHANQSNGPLSSHTKSLLSDAQSGKQMYNNGIENKWFKTDPDEGWIKGMISKKRPGPSIQQKNRMREERLNSKMYNNGTNQKFFLEDPGSPWVMGKLSPISTKGKRLYNNQVVQQWFVELFLVF